MFDRRTHSDVVGYPKTRNPGVKTRAFWNPNPTRTRELIPEQNPKPDNQNPKTRGFLGFQSFSKITGKYCKNQKKITKIFEKFSKKISEKFSFEIQIIIFSFLPFKVDKLVLKFLLKFFFLKKCKIIAFYMNFRHNFNKILKTRIPENPRVFTRTRQKPED